MPDEAEKKTHNKTETRVGMPVLGGAATVNGVAREAGVGRITVQNRLFPPLQGQATSCPRHATRASSQPRDGRLVIGLALASGM